MAKAKLKEAQPVLFEDAARAAPATKTKAKPATKAVAIHKPVQTAPAKQEPRNMLAIIAEAAANPAVDVAKMQALLQMQREIVAEEARIAFTEAFVAVQSELPTINKTGKIVVPPKDGKTGHVTPYATFNEINKVTRPILQKHGFALSFSTDAGPDGRLIVRGTLSHIRGFSRETTLALPLETGGSKNNVQGVGSSMSYGKRYAAIALLNLVSDALEDRDDDALRAGRTDRKTASVVIDGEIVDEVGPAKISKQQFDTLVRKIAQSGLASARFCESYKIDKVADLPAALFDEAMKACADFEQRVKERKGGK